MNLKNFFAQPKHLLPEDELARQLKYKTDIQIIHVLYQQTKIGLLASLLCAAIVFFALQHSIHTFGLYLWLSFFLGVTTFRLLIASIFLRNRNPNKNYQTWHCLFIAGTFLAGLSWGFVGMMLFPGTPLEQVLIVLIIAGVSAGAVPLLAPSIIAAVSFIIGALVPLIICLYIDNNSISNWFDLAATLYFLYLTMLIVKIHDVIRNSISLRFENEYLIKNLSRAKEELELINFKLEEAATHDPLTQVANRNLFKAMFHDCIKRAQEESKIIALFFIDLDNFKKINDYYGHHIGDEVLLIIATRLKLLIKNPNNISRLGGDELTVLVDDMERESIKQIAQKICDAVVQPIIRDRFQILVSASIGISIFPFDGTSTESLLKVADKNMYRAKEIGGNTFYYSEKVGSVKE